MDTCTRSSLDSKSSTHPNIRKNPLLCYISHQCMPSHSVLFRVYKEEIHPPNSVCEVPSYTRFINLVQTPFPLLNQFKYQTKDVYTTITILRLKENIIEAEIRNGNWVKQLSLCNFDSRNVYFLHVGKNGFIQPTKIVGLFSYSLCNP